MKTKRSVYALLAAVVLIWGLIAQRLWSAAQRPQPVDARVSNRSRAGGSEKADRLPPPLLLSYTDPFQSGRAPESRPSSEQLLVSRSLPPRQHPELALNFSSVPVTKPVPPVIWPEIKYLGSIANQRKGTKVALLLVDNLELTLKPGDDIKGIKAERIFADSILITFAGQKKTLLKN